jgi:hypothetical protein
MGVFIRAIVTGFGFSLGKALFDKISERLGLTSNNDPSPDGIEDTTDDIEDVDDES